MKLALRLHWPDVGSRLRPWVQRLALVLVAVLAWRTWYLEGLIAPCPVSSGSMAETLLGTHREVTCGDCGHRFVCGAELRPVRFRAICPNCGYADNHPQAQPILAGDRLLIDKSIFQFRRPRRWEVVAFRHPEHASRTVVKRVVGLPGESIQIRHGDVYVNGQIQRKTLRQQRALALLVHQADCQPSLDPVPPARWRGGKQSRWIPAGGRFVYPRIPGKRAHDDWLVYGHWRRVAGRPGRVRRCPVADLSSYNQTRPRRDEEVHPVGDLLLSLRLVRTLGRGRLLIRVSDGAEEFRVRIEPGGDGHQYEVLRNRRPVPGASGRLPPLGEGLRVEVSLFDRQFLLAFDRRPVVTLPYEPSRGLRQPSPRPLAIGSQGGLEVEICDLRVWRDVYYTHPIGVQGRWGLDEPVRLAEDEYFVLGDNSPVSEDSRTWPGGPGVPARLLVGKPLLVVFPARPMSLGGWKFQVPDPAKIRYIR